MMSQSNAKDWYQQIVLRKMQFEYIKEQYQLVR